MKSCISKHAISVLTATATALLFSLVVASPAVGAPDLRKCSKDIGKEGQKLQKDIIKRFSKCYDAYQKEVAKAEKKGTPVDVDKAAASCEKQLGKAIGGAGSNSKADKAFTKLTSNVFPKKCDDSHLQLLGHLPTATFANRWAAYVIVTSLQLAYEQQITHTRDFVNVMQTLADASGCPTCATLTTAPCQEHACTYLSAGSSNATVELTGLTIPVNLLGVTTWKICNTAAGNLLPGITNTNEYPVFGSTGKQIQAASIPGVGFACVKAIGAEGFISCGASNANLHVDYLACQDHNTDGVSNPAGATTSGACSGVCLASTEDTGQAGTGLSAHPGVINGGVCTDYTASLAVPGDSFINNTTQIAVVLNGELGPDGIPCTNDDTNASPGTPATTSLTTGTAESQIIDADDIDLNALTAGPLTGAPFNCANIQSSNLSGARVVGAFTALHSLTLGASALDNAVSFQLQCN